ncbi:zinc-binding alcohol dehydrogenase family protein [Alkalicoccobacillus porphyridii]|uniref:Zinc-binding alcohol dehydrogenase family protein n=1 Tax=Alkalicoccobacillus porphyridii TaxID=2597270 RepID=A0A554A1T7_9BACI|nr:zinc-binding alcohol dehydrogenase family protein [Alkalicoccobacillus porphyridii]TSB47660.1 zinc-binding alcohol dehydrogenase family protein [Alkalicoccobacillus porphyridii]
MKVIQVQEPGKLDIVTKEKPEIVGEKDVIVKVKCVGICGSDVHIYHGSNPFTVYPRVIGHEVSGVVEKIGPAVVDLVPGDRVALEPIVSCGTCYACRKNQPNVCVELEVFGVHRDGGMSEWVKADEANWHKVTERVTDEAAALVEPLTIGAQAMYRGEVEQGDSVFIMGAGPTGIACLIMAKEKGAKVIISDFNQNRLEYAQSIGADFIINPQQDNVEDRIKTITNEEMANVVIDAVGTAVTFEQAVQLASVAGTIVTLGFNEQPSAIPSLLLTKKELKVVGSRLQTHQFKGVIEKVNDGDIQSDAIVSHRYSFEQIDEAMTLLEKHPEEVRKIVLTF